MKSLKALSIDRFLSMKAISAKQGVHWSWGEGVLARFSKESRVAVAISKGRRLCASRIVRRVESSTTKQSRKAGDLADSCAHVHSVERR